jgi:hypothetical protein
VAKLEGQVLEKLFGERVTVVASVPIDDAMGLLCRFGESGRQNET